MTTWLAKSFGAADWMNAWFDHVWAWLMVSYLHVAHEENHCRKYAHIVKEPWSCPEEERSKDCCPNFFRSAKLSDDEPEFFHGIGRYFLLVHYALI